MIHSLTITLVIEIIFVRFGTIASSFYLVGFFLNLVSSDCFLLLLHLSLYLIAYYIRLLRIQLINRSQIVSSPWKGSKKVLLHLQESFAALSSVFSFPVLYIITNNLIMISFYVFSIIFGLIINTSNNIASTRNWQLPVLGRTIRCLINLLIVLHAADMPIHQVFYN